MASASAPAIELAVQLPAPTTASSDPGFAYNNKVCIVATNAWYTCSRTRYDMCSECGISAEAVKYCTISDPRSPESGPPAGSCEFANGSAGPTRGSAEKNPRVVMTASDPYLAGHDSTRPVTF